MTTPVADAETARAPTSPHRSAYVAAGTLVATGVILAAAFFPLMFNEWANYDDGGMFSVSLKVLLHHGTLYETVWADKYGPFYYLVMTTLYRVIHQDPTVANGRWIVLILTVGTVTFLAAAVWRVTKNLACSVLCEVGAFLILIQGAGKEPMHPGALGVFLVAIVVFELAGYAMRRSNAHMVTAGLATGALLMTKLNAGVFIVIAVVVAFLVGNPNVPRWLRIAVATLAALAPFVLVFQSISSLRESELAFLVAITVIAISVVMTIESTPLPTGALGWAAMGIGAAAAGSLAFPLLTGTPLSAALTGVFLRPLDQAGQLTVAPSIRLSWLAVLVTLAGVAVVVKSSMLATEATRGWLTWSNVTLAVVGLWLLWIAATVADRRNPTAEWLPALALLPAIAFCSRAPEPPRLALRFLVLIATLQILMAYPVAGTQVLWGSVAVAAPCAVAIALGSDRVSVWRRASPRERALATVLVAVVLVAASSMWPIYIWKSYLQNPRLDLAGTALIRVDRDSTAVLRTVTESLRAECDAFYGVPDENSFYLFADMPPLSGMVADRPIGLTGSQQTQVIEALKKKESAHARVCILRDLSPGPQIVPSRLRLVLRQYSEIVTTFGSYTISKRP
jgi:4-amino-4-deoxy-L-arabinose transferase-like glycosyltransferase